MLLAAGTSATAATLITKQTIATNRAFMHETDFMFLGGDRLSKDLVSGRQQLKQLRRFRFHEVTRFLQQ